MSTASAFQKKIYHGQYHKEQRLLWSYERYTDVKNLKEQVLLCSSLNVIFKARTDCNA